MERCILCKGELEKHKEVNEGVGIKGWKCKKCGETFFPSSEMLKWEVLTGKRGLVRKVRKIGNSIIVTLPKKLVKEEDIHKDDYILFERTKKGMALKIIHGE
ncbi:MAG: AbrB/MazE/SpoVT family DNA-binding domain-containing protein [Euryarchaeota archaeon]|nr:AbrB/MazE/SpoVT family DNA-binding domain-containing protein [Euryarchaeota archaeon]